MPTLLQPMASLAFALALVTPLLVLGFDPLGNDTVAVYWGQNSYGATNPNDTAGWQKTLSVYCQDDSIDVLPLAFLNVAFDTGGLPSMDLSNICNIVDDPVFPGTALPNCSFLASDIEECQANGKIVTISIGGQIGDVGLVSDSQAELFADTVWNLFLGGSSDMRPFGNATLDGVDLDIEQGNGSYWSTFVNQIRSHAGGENKTYYITGATQCPFPDAHLGSVINAVGVDAVYVQFYNNNCGLQAFHDPNGWNFAQWHDWATTVSPNKDVKVFIGAPAGPLAAGSGYVEADKLGLYALETRVQFSSFGGVVLWDASAAYANGNFSASIKRLLSDDNTPNLNLQPIKLPKRLLSASTQSPSTVTRTSGSPSSSPTSGSCGVVAPWMANVTYEGDNQVSYAWHIWTAKWQNNDDVPGGSSDAWEDNGICNPAEVKEMMTLAPSPVSEAAPAKTTPAATKAHWHRNRHLPHTRGHF